MPGPKRITWHDLGKKGLPENVTAVVNLAGQNVLDPTRRWSPGFKQNVWNSRINTTAALVKSIVEAKNKPKVFVNISGVSLYQPSEKKYTEADQGIDYDFMSKLCIVWEEAANVTEKSGVRQVKIRTGAVVGKEGGMIKSLVLPFWLGVGGVIGDGKQTLPWIHMTDLCNLIKYSIENEKVSGVLNGVAPQIITNADFTKVFFSYFCFFSNILNPFFYKAFASAMRRPAIFPMPEFVLNLLFAKERAVLLTTGAKIIPKRTQEMGFKFEFPDIKSACKEVV